MKHTLRFSNVHILGLASLLTVLGLSMLLVTGCSEADGASSGTESEDTQRQERVIRVETKRVNSTSFSEFVQLTGTIQALEDVVVSAEAGGRVTWLARLGQRVGPDDLVAKFDDRLLKSQLGAAQADYDLAQDTYRRQEALFSDSVISELEFETVRSRLQQAEASLSQAKKRFEDTQLTSSISGRVEERLVEAGELVSPGTPVARVVDTRRVKTRAGVPEQYAGDIKEGSLVRISIPAVDSKLEATVSFASRVVDPASRTFDVEVEIPNPSSELKPEMVADIAIRRRVVDNALVVPQNAVVHDDLGDGVYVVEESDRGLVAFRRNVSTGARFGGELVISSGLEAGEVVVVVGQSSLTDGNLVEIVESSGN